MLKKLLLHPNLILAKSEDVYEIMQSKKRCNYLKNDGKEKTYHTRNRFSSTINVGSLK